MTAQLGIKNAVREFLQERNGAAEEIGIATGFTTRQISQALADMMISGGAFKVDKKSHRPVYSAQNPQRNDSLPRPYQPEFKPLTPKNYDLWQARNLAMLVR